jgi:molecular chaperone DnaK
MNDRPLYLGIDLGTTNSAASIFDGSQNHLVRTLQGATLTPSVVRIDARAVVTVGARARQLQESDSENVRSEFKRLMGTKQVLHFRASGKSLKPEELSAEILKSLRADVRDQFGFDPAHAVISAPALFELPQSSATSEAARLAGFDRVELIQEPIASALAAGWTDESSGTWMVYDLGGGTFDASLLETRDGLLRVIGHDGDNFLGGRDFDMAMVDLVLELLSPGRPRPLLRSNSQNTEAIRKLKLAVEEAKIELTRLENTRLQIPNLQLDGTSVDVDIEVSREEVSRRCTALVDRSIAVCRRLLETHGMHPSQVSRIVLVGGPTAMPIVRQRLSESLGVTFAGGLDPMTLVAQGAALYAASANLDARPAVQTHSDKGRRIWLQYPAMTSDLTPYVVGRVSEEKEPGPASVRFEREGWTGVDTPVNKEGAFVATVHVLPQRTNEFRILGTAGDGSRVVLSPSTIRIIHGLTINDPPLSRAIGIALASNRTHIYFERGSPLPARRTFFHEVVETLTPGNDSSVLRIPIIQGEFEKAHLCRLVGTLEIRGSQVANGIPSGSSIEVTLAVDRSGRLSAQALTASGQVFEEISHLLVPDAPTEILDHAIRDLRKRLSLLFNNAFQRRNKGSEFSSQLGGIELNLTEAERDAAAARAGDADAAQKARRRLIELDAELDALEQDAQFPKLEAQAVMDLTMAMSLISVRGTPQEQRLLDEAASALEKARKDRDITEMQARLQQIHALMRAAYFRDPDAWKQIFNMVASRINSARDLPLARKLVDQGRNAIARGDQETLMQCTRQLVGLMPADEKTRQLGHDSGIR